MKLPPRAASRIRSSKVAMPVPAIVSWVACSNRALFATAPKFQPSPYRKTFLPSTPSESGVIFRRAACTSSMVDFGSRPIRSKRKPSTLYSRAHSATESTTRRFIMACSGAVSAQQLSVVTLPLASSRW